MLFKNDRVTYVRYRCGCRIFFFICHYMLNWCISPIFATLLVWHDKLRNLCGTGQNTSYSYVFIHQNIPRIKISWKKCIRRELNIIMETKPPFKRFRSNRASMYTVLVLRYKLFAAVCKTAMRNERSCRTTLEW